MTSGRILGLLIVAQLLDVLVHVAVGQLEPVRMLANAFLVGGATDAVVGSRRALALGLGGLLYLLLNLWFVWQEGLINPATESLRLPLVAFVGVSLGLTLWMSRLGGER